MHKHTHTRGAVRVCYLKTGLLLFGPGDGELLMLIYD